MERQLIEHRIGCKGLNSHILADRDLVTVTRFFPPTKTEIPMSRLRAVELVVSSIFPPILLSLSSVIFLVGVWWFAGGGLWPVVLDNTYRSICSWAILGAVLGIAIAGYSWAFGSINITTTDNHTRSVIRVVPRHSGERFVDALRHMMQLKEQ